MPRVIRGIEFSQPVPIWKGREAQTSSGFGPRTGGRYAVHYGDDMVYPMLPGEHVGYPVSTLSGRSDIYGWIMPNNIPALAAASGTVNLAKRFDNGYAVRIDHGQGLETEYLHLSKLSVKKGDKVLRGQPIGTIGHDPTESSSLNHLHFELHDHGVPVDPEPFMTGWPALRNPRAGHPVLWALAGVGAAVSVWYVLSRTRRIPARYALPALPIGDVGLAPPSPRAAKLIDIAFNPWAPEARRRRAAQEFLDVRAKSVREIVPRELPKHIYPFAEYMRQMSEHPISSRDIIKAYLVTVGSMRRAAIGADKVRAQWKNFPGPKSGSVRPEDVLGDLLESPAGQTYLQAATKGRFDKKAAKTIVNHFGAWGFKPTFYKQLKHAVTLGEDAPSIDRILKQGRRRSWYRYVEKRVPGVSIAKAGFLASLLGRGDMATADARELNFWLCPLHEWERDKRKCRTPLGDRYDVNDLVDDDFMHVFNKKMRALRMRMPPRYKPFYEHLAHHALWDAVAETKTSHQNIIDAMKNA